MQGQNEDITQDGIMFVIQSQNEEDQRPVGIPITSKFDSGRSKFSGPDGPGCSIARIRYIALFVLSSPPENRIVRGYI